MLLKKRKDIKIRSLFKKLEIKKIIMKFILINLISNPILLKNLKNKFILINKKIFKYSKIKIKGRCILTNRKSGINHKFLLSRVILRDLMQFGIIPGFKKAVW
jgi:ribosomal protein S14